MKYRENCAKIFDIKTGEKKSNSKYATLEPVISLNILGYTHFNSIEALHFFRLYDVKNQKYTNKPNRYMEIYFEVMKKDSNLSDKLKHWQYYFQTGGALPDAPDYIKELAEIMLISNLTNEERNLHEIYVKNKLKLVHREMYVERVAEERGLEQGREEERTSSPVAFTISSTG